MLVVANLVGSPWRRGCTEAPHILAITSSKKETVMRTQNTRTQLIGFVILIVALALIWLERPVSRVLAFQDSEDKPSPMGVAFGQTLYLNVANTGNDNAVPVEMMILDGEGNPLAMSRRLVRPGHAESLAVNRDDIAGRSGSRVLTRAVVNSLGGPDTRGLVVSEEVVDNETQRTMILHPGISKGFNPQPDPPGVR